MPLYFANIGRYIILALYKLFQSKNRYFDMCLPASRSSEISLPPQYWNALSQDDRCEFMRLRSNFRQGPKVTSKDFRIVTFSKELSIVIRYLERSPENAEARCVLVGVCFVGPYVCVNTRQLKTFLGRCKSSINGSFQQLGYVALKTKAKAKACVITALPSLQNNQSILRQWTVRYVSDDMKLCFFTSFSPVGMPAIVEGDLYDERKPRATKTAPNYSVAPMTVPMGVPHPMPMPMPMCPFPVPTRPLETKHIEFELMPRDETDDHEGSDSVWGISMQPSLSLDCLQESRWELDLDMVVADEQTRKSQVMPRSASGYVHADWNDPYVFNLFE